MRHSVLLTGKRVIVLAVLFVALLVVATAVISGRVRAAETRAAAESITKGDGEVTAGELAQWILEKRQDYQLIDLREPWHYDDYHIPMAINIPLNAMFEPQGVSKLDKQKKVVVYSMGAGHAAKTQLLLAMKGYRAYALKDGIIGWWDEVMTPISLRSANPSSTGYQQARQLREHFTVGNTIATPPAATMPAPVAVPAGKRPSPSAVTKPASGEKKAVPQPAKTAAPPAQKPAPAATPSEQEKQRLKLGTGCS